MEFNRNSSYKALKSRDARFDGRFFVGVKTTGIYCRPVCPAKTPKLENIHFYACAAAAEEDGFRPCLRCRPETSPGTPAWQGTSATVSRALRLIDQGELDTISVDELAGKLGVGDRHLRRLFLEHIGAAPLAVAQTRRVQLAKRLLDETVLPISDVAFGAGFSSVRRFNDAMKRTYKRTPRELRKGRADKHATSQDRFSLRLAYRPPYDWDGIVDFLRGRAIPGVEEVVDGEYRRAVRVNGSSGVVCVNHDAKRSALSLTMPASFAVHITEVVAAARRLFDLGADPTAIEAHLKSDPLLASAIRKRKGLRVPGAWDSFETTVRGILGQQISVKGATTISGRLAQRYGEPLSETAGTGLTHLFPTPDRLIRLRPEGIGLTKKRAETVRGLARAVLSEKVCLQNAASLEEFVADLCELPGIGPWTANYAAMRALGEPDAFPSGDLGLRKALAKNGELASEKEVLARADAWRPWRGYAALYLWSTLDSGG